MSLLEKMRKVGSIKSAELLSESSFFNEKEGVPTEVPIINMALSGKVDGGLVSGLTFLAGPSNHFKSLLAICAFSDLTDCFRCFFFPTCFFIIINGLLINVNN